MIQLLTALFPENEFSLLAVVVLFPALGAFVNGIFGKRLGKEAVRMMALSAMGGSFLAALAAFVTLRAYVAAGHEHVSFVAWHWLDLSTAGGNGSLPIEVGFFLDPLNSVMMLVITGVGFLIHLYATSYMWDDARKDGGFHRFFAYLNLFCFAMLVLVLGSSLPVLFVGWEGVGLCSYLLIGFWYSDDANAAAGKKAFVANRIGDFGLLTAMAMLVYYTGALDWEGIRGGAHGLLQDVQIWPIGHPNFPPLPSFLEKIVHWAFVEPRMVSAATVVGLLLFLGCAGKSAQFPLYVWLPDAMAGPTPVSALIHAATMVTAGVYLVCRMADVFLLSPLVMAVVACTGAFTALFAASIGLAQNDIKKVLAYSTVSQLGYMFLGVGVGAFSAGFFHVFTHAFFKACLFLGAGSVIHAMHARIHDNERSQDIRQMGGLRKWMPFTYLTFLVSCLAIAGLPPLSGFFSKDEILYRVFVNHISAPHEMKGGWEAAAWFGPMLYVVGIITAAMTAFYMFRALFVTFWGEFRGWTIDPKYVAVSHGAHAGATATPAALSGGHAGHDAPGGHDDHGAAASHGGHDDHAAHGAHDHDGHGADDAHDDDDHHHEESGPLTGPTPHESPLPMTLTLVVLAAFAGLAGFFSDSLIFHVTPMEKWLDPVFEAASEVVKIRDGVPTAWQLAGPGILACFVGIGVAYWMYVAAAGAPAKRFAASIPRLYRLVLDKWRIDELYEASVLGLVDAIGDTCRQADKWIVDGIIARLTALVVSAFGAVLRTFQSGVVHTYAAIMTVGLAAVGWFVWQPHASYTIRETTSGHDVHYVIETAPGFGYGYRWYSKAADEPDAKEWQPSPSVELDVPEGESKAIKLEVKNAFGRIKTVDVPVGGAKPTAAVDTPRGAALARAPGGLP